MTYSIKPLSCDLTRLKGLSEKLIVSHHQNSYGGAVKRLNVITKQLAALDFAKTPVFIINKREEPPSAGPCSGSTSRSSGASSSGWRGRTAPAVDRQAAQRAPALARP